MHDFIDKVSAGNASFLPYLLLALAIGVVGLLIFLRSRRRAPSAVGRMPASEDFILLWLAAEQAYARAKRNGMALAGVAEVQAGDGGPVLWFAKNLVRIIPIYGTETATQKFEQIDKQISAKMQLSDDATRGTAENVEYTGLSVTKVDLEKYIKWARDVQ